MTMVTTLNFNDTPPTPHADLRHADVGAPRRLQFPDTTQTPAYSSITQTHATSPSTPKKNVLDFSTLASQTSPTPSGPKQLFGLSPRDTEIWTEKCLPFQITDSKEIQRVRSLFDGMTVGRPYTFSKFDESFSFHLNDTSQQLLQWGASNFQSPLMDLMNTALASCKAFESALKPGSTWKFWESPDPRAIERTLNDADSAINAFVDAMRVSSNASIPATSDSLESLLAATISLTQDLVLYQAALELRLIQLGVEIQEFEREANKGRDTALLSQAKEAANTLSQKKAGYPIISTSLQLQQTQIQQMMAQQQRGMNHMNTLMSTTFPLWRTRALACLQEQTSHGREQALNAFQDIHRQITTPSFS